MAKILVLEDDPDSRDLLSFYLACRGHKVTAVRDGWQGLCEDLSNYELIILDLRMPNVDGAQFKRTLDARGVNTPIIVVSGEYESERVAKELRVAGFLRKPVDLDLLDEVVSAHCPPPDDEGGPDSESDPLKRTG